MSMPAERVNPLEVWRESPETFVRDVIGVTPEPWQARVLHDIAQPGAHVSVRSGHGVGKSALASWVVLWHHATHFPAKTPCSAPTLHQLQDVLWSELAIWHKRLPEWLRAQYSLRASDQDLRFYLADHPAESYAVARTGRKDNPEALQGFHSENLLFVLDEASGIDDVVFQVAGGALSTEGARVLMTSNPTRLSGYFHSSHHANRKFWACHRVSCEDSSRVARAYIEQQAAEYGVESSVYRVRVLGEFPRQDDDVLMPLDLVEAAVDRDVAPITTYMPVWGLDVARFGSCRTALAKRRQNQLLEPVKSWHKRDLMEVAGLVLAEYEDTPSNLRPVEILVDAIGLGAGVVDRLRELNVPVRGINVAEIPAARERHNRLRDELWWRAREWFESRQTKIPRDDTLIGQLASVRYTFTSAGKVQVEGKERMLERGVASPDEADAFVLTFAGLDKRGVASDRYERRAARPKGSWMTR